MILILRILFQSQQKHSVILNNFRVKIVLNFQYQQIPDFRLFESFNMFDQLIVTVWNGEVLQSLLTSSWFCVHRQRPTANQ